MDSEQVEATPFDEDCAIANLFGAKFSVYRRTGVEVTDEGALKAAGMFCQVPDYPRIRKLLLDGREVPGAKLAGIEYVLRRK